MERDLLNSEGLNGNFEKDSELIRGFYFALPHMNLINQFIYELHYNNTLDCLQSVLEYDFDYKYHDKPQFINLSFSKESLLKPEIKNEKIILNQNETSFINNLYFEEIANKRFLSFRESLNKFLFSYKDKHRYKIIYILENLISISFKEVSDSKKIVGPSLDYAKFKDIVNYQLEETNSNIKENILNLQNLNEEKSSFEDKLLLKAIKSENQDLIAFIRQLDTKCLGLFFLKWENKAFEALKLILEIDKKNLSDYVRLIYFLVEPDTIHIYKNILDALPQEYDYDNAKRYFNEINTSSKNDILTYKSKCIYVKNLIATHLK